MMVSFLSPMKISLLDLKRQSKCAGFRRYSGFRVDVAISRIVQGGLFLKEKATSPSGFGAQQL
jgi:hypothetical protein